jgi:serine protease Do
MGGMGKVGRIVTAAALGIALGLQAASAQGTLSALQTDVDQITRRARPSVVTVFAYRLAPRRAGQAGSSEHRVHTRVGSGVALEANVVLTTASVARGAPRVQVRTANGLQVDAVLVGLDPIFNLALLRVPSVRLPALRFATRRASVGDWVISLGTSYRAQPTQSVGNIAYRLFEPHQSLLQLTNTVYPGNSGAAALNTRGELVGVVQGELAPPGPVSQDADRERRPSGVSFALPVETVRPVYESLRQIGRVPHGFLGVTTRALSLQSDFEGGQSTPLGAQVQEVVTGSPAERAGIKPGDLIVAYERERVEYPEQLARWVAATRPKSRVELVWVRGDVGTTGRTVLTESPAPVPAWAAADPGEEQTDRSPVRIAELEKEIQRLSEELSRLKDRPAQPR